MWGREQELQRLLALRDKPVASLAVIRGRRRIGKSTLARFFAKHCQARCIEISGLAPRPKQTNQDQLDNFARSLEQATGITGYHFTDWSDAFRMLSLALPSQGNTVVILDEISWMAEHDPDFAGKLKIAWDTLYSSQQLVLILCGSVSAWIQRSILNAADFVGRVSLDLILGELPLTVVNNFWGDRAARISLQEKLSILLITGGVPKYLEEFPLKQSAEKEIQQQCFLPGGFLFAEYDKVFNEIFQKRARIYKRIIEQLVDRKRSMSSLARAIGTIPGGDLSSYLGDLEVSGYIARDYQPKPGGQRGKKSEYRISDNYLRFYLKYIMPIRDRIQRISRSGYSFTTLIDWDSIRGLQFENLILHNLDSLITMLGIEPHQLLGAAPYTQRKSSSNAGGCQIDILIECDRNTVYLCELKSGLSVDRSVIKQMERKMKLLRFGRRGSVRPVLIHSGEIKPDDSVVIRKYFDKVISFNQFLGPQ